MDRVVDILLNSRDFIKWETEGTVFWILLALFFCLLYYSLKMPREDRVYHSLYVSLLCAGIVFLYTGMTGEVFWFLNIKKVGLIMIFALAFTAILFGAAMGNTWGNLKNVSRISSDVKFGFWSLIVSLAWGVTLIRLVLIVFEEHPILCTVFVLASMGSLSKAMDSPAPANPVPEPDDGNNTSTQSNGKDSVKENPKDDGPYKSNGFPCCDNCRWNLCKGSVTVRCFQDETRKMRCNDKCGQWERC